MEVMFDCFFDETFARLERSGLQSRQKRRDVIDHLAAIIMGSSKGILLLRFFDGCLVDLSTFFAVLML